MQLPRPQPPDLDRRRRASNLERRTRRAARALEQVQSNKRDVPSAWRTGGDGFGEAPLTVGTVFDDLIAGVAALRAQADAHAAHLELRLAEAPSEEDPLVHLRPSSPAGPRFDVVITDVGTNQAALTRAMMESTGQYEGTARDLLRSAAPITVAHARLREQSRSIADALARAGAATDLRRNDA